MTTRLLRVLIVAVALLPTVTARASQDAAAALQPGAKVFIAEMPDGFDAYFKAALVKKKVPVVVVPTRAEANFEIKGTSETQKAGAAKKIFMLNWHSDEQASVSITSLASGEIVYAYSTNKKNSAHGKQSSAESCAKHLKAHMEKAKKK